MTSPPPGRPRDCLRTRARADNILLARFCSDPSSSSRQASSMTREHQAQQPLASIDSTLASSSSLPPCPFHLEPDRRHKVRPHLILLNGSYTSVLPAYPHWSLPLGPATNSAGSHLICASMWYSH